MLAKTIDNKFFQRATVFIGTPEMSHYTIQADVMSDGNRRKMSEVGVINQRYLIVLKGNEQKLEVNSNLERLRAAEDFKWSPNVWYRLKARVDRHPDGSAVVRAKAWKRDEPEPAEWTIEVPHKTAHQTGSPGLFGFSPQDMRGLHRQHGGHAGWSIEELNQLNALHRQTVKNPNVQTAVRPPSPRVLRKSLGTGLQNCTRTGILKTGKWDSSSFSCLQYSCLPLLICGGFTLLAVCVRAQDWPQWGGTPARNMFCPATGLPDQFTKGNTGEIKFNRHRGD